MQGKGQDFEGLHVELLPSSLTDLSTKSHAKSFRKTYWIKTWLKHGYVLLSMKFETVWKENGQEQQADFWPLVPRMLGQGPKNQFHKIPIMKVHTETLPACWTRKFVTQDFCSGKRLKSKILSNKTLIASRWHHLSCFLLTRLPPEVQRMFYNFLKRLHSEPSPCNPVIHKYSS